MVEGAWGLCPRPFGPPPEYFRPKERLDAGKGGVIGRRHEEPVHHYLLHYSLLTFVAGRSFTFPF